MNKDNLKYAPIFPGRIQQFYPINPFIIDTIFFVTYLVFLKFFKSFERIVDKKLDDRLKGIVDNNKLIKVFGDGRSSLLYALKSLNLNNGDEVIINPNTCEVVCKVIISAGLVPIFIPTNESGLGEINLIENFISEKTRAIILTNTYGILENYDKYAELAETFGLVVINDLAQANLFDEITRNIIIKSTISVLSFGPEKYLGALCGGVLVSNNAMSAECTENNMTDKEILNVIISRFKHWFTFICHRFKLLKFFLKYRCLTYDFQDYKNLKLRSTTPIKIKTLHQVAKLSIIFRFWLLTYHQERERNNFIRLRSLVGDIIMCSNYTESIPLFAVLNLKNLNRNKLAMCIANEGFQTLWNYVPLYEYENYTERVSLLKTNYWENFLQVPFRFLSSDEILHLSKVIKDNTKSKNFFDRSDWIETLERNFNLKKNIYTCTIDGEKKELNLLSNGKDLYLNFMGYFNPNIDNLNEHKLIELISSIEKKEGKQIVRMKLFPGIKLQNPLKFIPRTTQILDISQFQNLTKDLRYEVNKALKADIYTRLLTETDIEDFYRIYLETVNRVESDYVTPVNLFYEIIKLQDCFILGAFKEGCILGGSVYLCSGNYAFYWWNATNHEGRKFSVNYLITYEAIKLLQMKSIMYLDFASSHNQKIFKSKQKWGAEEIVYYEYLIK